jgi:hypothetical protein
MTKHWRFLATIVGALFGYGLSTPTALQANSDWKWCTEWTTKGKCVTCVQATNCGSQPVCCKIAVE